MMTMNDDNDKPVLPTWAVGALFKGAIMVLSSFSEMFSRSPLIEESGHPRDGQVAPIRMSNEVLCVVMYEAIQLKGSRCTICAFVRLSAVRLGVHTSTASYRCIVSYWPMVECRHEYMKSNFYKLCRYDDPETWSGNCVLVLWIISILKKLQHRHASHLSVDAPLTLSESAKDCSLPQSRWLLGAVPLVRPSLPSTPPPLELPPLSSSPCSSTPSSPLEYV
jgi:hypothetical protein